ncbi:hypothetical protein [Neoactinobaculum massilliense]|uniref:hypothetical protein n=1 Tax=Neoactinobaculum massilliense TaxID=2364794 RepID=UPI000F53D184|nr:hypothetical protein [Neoactinobaculum massilliense]
MTRNASGSGLFRGVAGLERAGGHTGRPLPQRVKQLALALLVVLALVLLTACGAKVDTKLTLDEKGAGSRVMTLTMSTQDAADATSSDTGYIHGGMDAVDASIKQHVPAGLSYSGMTNDGTNYTGTFTLTFSSIADYQEKAAALLAASGDDTEPTVSFSTGDNGLLQGDSLKENFTSRDLLAWLPQYLVADGVVDQENETLVFDSPGSTVVTIAGKEYSASDTDSASVDDAKDYTFKYVDVTLDVKENGTYGVVVVYTPSYDVNGPAQEAQQTFLKGATPEGGTRADVSEQDSPHGTAGYSISFDAADLKAAQAGLRTALGDDSATLAVKEKKPDAQALTIGTDYTVHVNAAGVVSSSDDLAVHVVAPAGWTSADGSANDSGRTEVTLDGGGTASFTRGVSVSKLTADLSMDLSRNLTSEYQFTVPQEDADAFGDAIPDALKKSTGADDVEQDSDKKNVTYTVSVAGTKGKDTVSDLLTMNLGLADSSAAGQLLQPYTQLGRTIADYAIVWNVNVYDLVPHASVGSVEATVTLPFGNRFDADKSNASGWTIKGRTATFKAGDSSDGSGDAAGDGASGGSSGSAAAGGSDTAGSSSDGGASASGDTAGSALKAVDGSISLIAAGNGITLIPLIIWGVVALLVLAAIVLVLIFRKRIAAALRAAKVKRANAAQFQADGAGAGTGSGAGAGQFGADTGQVGGSFGVSAGAAGAGKASATQAGSGQPGDQSAAGFTGGFGTGAAGDAAGSPGQARPWLPGEFSESELI